MAEPVAGKLPHSPVPTAPAGPQPLQSRLVFMARLATVALALLLVLCLAWELWLAPLRPGGSWLALKALPLVFATRSLARRNTRGFRWWSMAVLAYVCEGAVRMISDQGLSAALAIGELTLASVAFLAILQYMRLLRQQAAMGSAG